MDGKELSHRSRKINNFLVFSTTAYNNYKGMGILNMVMS